MNVFALIKQYWDWAFENPEKHSVTHAAFIFWLIELNNRLGWKVRFGLPTFHTMEVLNIKSYKTYKSVFDDLVKWGFIKLHQKATNNHTANLIELVIFYKSDTNSLTNSIITSFPSEVKVNVTIDKPETDKPETKKKKEEPEEIPAPPQDFISSIISLFAEEYKTENQIEYTQIAKEKERSAAAKILKVHKQENPEMDSEQTLESLRLFFRACVSINDNWHHTKMSLPHIVSQFNEIKNTLKNGNKKSIGVTDRDLGLMIAKKFGRNPQFDPDNQDLTTNLNDKI